MNARLLRFGLAFFALTLPLTWLWMRWGQALYVELLVNLADLVGLPLEKLPRRSPAAGRFVSVVPFLVLMWVTPALGWRKRLWGSLVGLLLLSLTHVALLSLLEAGSAFGRGRRNIARLFPFVIMTDGVPLALWLFLARDFLRSVIPVLREPGER